MKERLILDTSFKIIFNNKQWNKGKNKLLKAKVLKTIINKAGDYIRIIESITSRPASSLSFFINCSRHNISSLFRTDEVIFT